MRFIDNAIRITILEKFTGRTNSFKAYLEDFDISFSIEAQKLEFAALSEQARDMVSATRRKLKMSFNVFAEERVEAVSNYTKLENLMNITRPIIQEDDMTGVSSLSAANAQGNAVIYFDGLPSLSYGMPAKRYLLLITNFSFSINKEMGFIQIPYDDKEKRYDKTQSGIFVKDKMRLIPVGYKVSIEGNIIMTREQAYQIFSKGSVESNPKPSDSSTASSGAPDSAGGGSSDGTSQKTQAEKTQEKSKNMDKAEAVATATSYQGITQGNIDDAVEVLKKATGDQNAAGNLSGAPEIIELTKAYLKVKEYTNDDGTYKPPNPTTISLSQDAIKMANSKGILPDDNGRYPADFVTQQPGFDKSNIESYFDVDGEDIDPQFPKEYSHRADWNKFNKYVIKAKRK